MFEAGPYAAVAAAFCFASFTTPKEPSPRMKAGVTSS
jgi:hypothetical protein